jgi:hypothetical protein
VVSECVEEGIGGGVVGLSWGAEDASEGGEEDEGVEVEVGGELMEGECGVELWVEDAVYAVGGHGAEDAVVEESCGMDDGGEGVLLRYGVEESAQSKGVCDVAVCEGDGGAGEMEARDEGMGVFGGGGESRGEDEVTYAVSVNEVRSDEGAEGARAAGDEDSAARVDVAGECEDELSDVPCLSKEAEGVRRAADVPCGDGEREEDAAVEEVCDHGEHLLDAIEACVGEVEGLVSDGRVALGDVVLGADIGLSHLEEASTAWQEPERGVDEVVSEGVEDEVDAAASGGAQEVRLEVEGAGRSDVVVVELEGAEGVPFGWASGGEDLCAEVSCELEGGHADAACSGVDEDALARLEVPEVDESVIGGEEGEGSGRGLSEGEVLRDGDDGAPVSDGDGAEGGREEAHDPVSGGEIVDARADVGDDAGALCAEGTRLTGIHAERIQEIAEVEPCGADSDPDVSVSERRRGVLERDEGEVVDRASGGDMQVPGGRGERDGESARGRSANECWSAKLAVPESELGQVVGECA